MKLNKRLITIAMLLQLLCVAFIIVYSMPPIQQDREEVWTGDSCEVVDHGRIYLAAGEEYDLPVSNYVSDRDNVSIVNGGTIRALTSGTAYVSDQCNTYEVYVSDLYTIPAVNNEKPFLGCGDYTLAQNDELDEILKYYIEKVGYHSRAAAVEAVRFLTLRFPYKLHYFYENGRLSPNNDSVFGEGRYYYKGLYLSLEKSFSLTGSNEPSCWGCEIYEETSGSYTANGLDCSGLISWALLNAGYDCGDIGAGPTDNVLDLTDLGEKKDLSELSIEMLKVGDLVGLDGHIGMIIGIKDGVIYVGEAYWVKDLQVRTYTFDDFFSTSEWDYAILMDGYYVQDGDLTPYWD